MKNVFLIGLLSVFTIACSSDNIESVNNDKVSAVNDSYQSIEDKVYELPNFLSNDSFSSLGVTVTFDATTTKGGTVTKNGNSYFYTPAKSFVGSDSFTYKICSKQTVTNCATATVTINVKASSSKSNFTIPSDLSSYYNSVDFTLTGSYLKDALASKIVSSHTTFLTYTPDVWNVLKQSDLDPTDNTKVLLIYGYNDTDNSTVNDRTRGKNNNSGRSGDWNREHVYPKSLGNPNLGRSGPGSDAHNLRASDVSFNSERGNKKFATGTGNAGNSSGGWYPGDEWKGDVARMMLYMYLRYGNQCLPKNVAIGSTVSSDANMVLLFLKWNAQDPVSDFEKQRNTIISNAQGNRNPFIDNPYLATVIWGGNDAENRW